MAIAKVTLNGVTQMDVTQKTVTAGSMLNGITALKNDGTDITGSIATKTSSDLTASGATVTAPAGYYATAASKSVGTMTLPTSAAASATSGFTSKATIGRSTSDQYINIPTGYNSAGAYYKVSAVANGSATTPATTVTANPSISVNSSTGVITATASATKSITPTVSAGYISSGTAGTVTVSGSNTSQLSTQAGTTITPTESEQTAVAAGKYTLGAVKVGAISSSYIGSDIPAYDSDDVTIDGATVSGPSGGYWNEGFEVTIPSGTEGTPTATKGTVSGNSVSVTPSVTNTAGYISGGTKTGTAVTVTASELVSGTKSITASGNTDVTNYATASVAAQTLPTSAAASATSGFTSKATIGRSTSDQYINIPTGYNSTGAYYKVSAVANGSAATPATTITVTPSISVGSDGLITATALGAQSITPTVSAGYVSSGSAGFVTVNGSNTSQLSTQAAKTVTPTESEQTAVAAGKFTTGAVKVGAISSTYVGSGITQRSSSDLTASGATVTAPAGYYASAATKSVSSMTLPTAAAASATSGFTSKATISRSTSDQYINIPTGYNSTGAYYKVSAVANGSATTPATTITANPSISVSSGGLITATASASQSVTPTVSAGYVSSGTAGTVSVSGSATNQLTTQAGGLIAPDECDDLLHDPSTRSKYVFRATDLVRGQWEYNVPKNTPNTRARTQDFIYVASGATITYTVNSYDVYFQIYSSKSSSTIAQNIGWKTTSGSVNITVSGYLTFVTRNHSNTSAVIDPLDWDGSVIITNTTSYGGIDYVWNGETCTVSGLTTSGSISDIVSWSDLPATVEPNKTYYATVSTTNEYVRLSFRFKDSSNQTIDPNVYFNTNGFITIPANAVTWNVCIHVSTAAGNITSATINNIHLYNAESVISAGTYATGDIVAASASDHYVGSEVPLIYAQDIHPSTTDQTLSGGSYLKGDQTIKAVTTTNLTAANIANGVTVKIGDASDDDCIASVTGTMSSGIMSETDLRNYLARSNSFTDITWPSNTATIGAGAFYNCRYFNPTGGLPSTLVTIGERAFYNCSQMALSSLPSGITSLNAESAFYNCSAMTLSTLPSGITGTIQNYCFNGCSNITLTSLPSGITSIGQNAFYNCYKLALTSLPNSITAINSYAFGNCYLLALSTLPATITAIYASAFQNCESIQSISCTGTITTFSSNAFTGSASHPMQIKTASFPNMTASVNASFGSTIAANACQLLEFLDLGSTNSIGSNSFANCYSLRTLVLRRTSVCSLVNVSAFTNTPFNGYNNLTGTVYVPSSLIASYKTATNWSTLYNNGTVTFSAIEGSDYEL